MVKSRRHPRLIGCPAIRHIFGNLTYLLKENIVRVNRVVPGAGVSLALFFQDNLAIADMSTKVRGETVGALLT